MNSLIPFNRASFRNSDLEYVKKAIERGPTAGNGPFTRRAEDLLSIRHLGAKALLTTSCTHALELSARLMDLQPGDEVIVPAYTFVSSASAFVWNGARPVFVDVNPLTRNIDIDLVSDQITNKTKAICLVHYAGIAEHPERFRQLADDRGIVLIEDNAHGFGGFWRDKPLGTFGHLSTLSFHETKNISCGEGGALIVNDPRFVERAEILREKGTDRSKFMRGQVDKYTWIDLGSSWVISDILAALLVGQLERMDEIQASRLGIWNEYSERLESWADQEGVKLPFIPEGAKHPAHMFSLFMRDLQHRQEFIEHMKRRGIMAVFHYQDLNSSPYGEQFKKDQAQLMTNSISASERLVRLPLFADMTNEELQSTIGAVLNFRS